jgi:PAS domain S-box-containing protein
MQLTSTRAKVLVVDDEPSILASISDLLEPEFEVATAENPQRALELLAVEEISVLVSDQRMPTMNGDQFLNFAKEQSSATRILLTGFADIAALARAVNDGRIYSYVSKPWDPLALRTTVRNAVREYRLTKALRYERDLLRTLIDNIPDCVYVQDAGQRYTLVNSAFATLAKMASPAAAVGKTDADCLPEEFARVASRDGRTVIETGQPMLSKCDEWKQDAATSRWFSSTRVPLRSPIDGRVEGLAGISIDITKHKEIESQLRTAKEIAEATAQAKQQFLALASHEIRTPLNSILGVTDLLSDSELSEQQRGLIDVCRANGQTLTRLLDDLSDLSRSDVNQPKLKSEELNICELLDSVIASYRPIADLKQVKLVLECGDPLPKRLLGDAVRLKQILGNLIGNSLKFTSQGQIVVTVDCLSVENEKALLAFAVKDTGIGVAAEKLDIIFEPFSQAEDFITRKYGGTGLGLTICRQLITQMGGAISVESSLGVGSVFRFTASLPVVRTQRANGAHALGGPLPQSSFAGLSVLVAEDNADGMLLMKSYLRSAKLEIAWNGREAVEKFIAGKFDVVLMDLQMPEIDGLQATRIIREWESRNQRPPTPILACTAHASSDDSLKAGCNGHLAKPIFRQTLSEAVAKHVKTLC